MLSFLCKVHSRASSSPTQQQQQQQLQPTSIPGHLLKPDRQDDGFLLVGQTIGERSEEYNRSMERDCPPAYDQLCFEPVPGYSSVVRPGGEVPVAMGTGATKAAPEVAKGSALTTKTTNVKSSAVGQSGAMTVAPVSLCAGFPQNGATGPQDRKTAGHSTSHPAPDAMQSCWQFSPGSESQKSNDLIAVSSQDVGSSFKQGNSYCNQCRDVPFRLAASLTQRADAYAMIVSSHAPNFLEAWQMDLSQYQYDFSQERQTLSELQPTSSRS